ncbi:MAG: DNA-directed RNA polymerase subunit RpoH/Rpb5 C-terminal domain-containing protein, partial [Candidatus Lutacidiplasmatales archaeon]
PKRRALGKAKGKKGAAAAPVVTPRPFTAHHLDPPHELLSQAETEETLKLIGTTIDRLPKILLTDPGMKTDKKFVAAREAREPLNGRLVRVRRPSQTAGEAIAYRVLVTSSTEA